jgi:hypothetical protein
MLPAHCLSVSGYTDVGMVIWKVMKWLLIAVGSVIGVMVLLMIAATIAAMIDNEDTFYVRHAQFVNSNYLSELEALRLSQTRVEEEGTPHVYAHRLTHGSGTVFGYRFYSAGQVGVIDDEHYRKLTIWVAEELPSRATLDLADATKIIAIYGYGGAAWPRSGCAGRIRVGNVRFDRNGGEVSVHVVGTFMPDKVGRRTCEAEAIDLTFEAREMLIEDLTPWLGVAGRHPYRETHG